jgi:PleD family two-component response regulator
MTAKGEVRMKVDAMATRMSVLTRAVPMRILLVDDDDLELELMADRLATAGFEVEQAVNGAEALRILEQRWFPVVVTDWQMPVVDGIGLTESLRARGVRDTYIIMLTMREASLDYERGYAAGVDDYLTKKVPDAELFARINAAFNTLALRRSLAEARDALEESVPVDPDSGVFTPRELQARLQSEICRAERYGRQLSVITVGIRSKSGDADLLSADTVRGVAQTLVGVVRAHVDWVGRLETQEEAAFAVVLPEAGIADGPAIKERLLAALRRVAHSESLDLVFTFGLSGLERSGPNAPSVDTRALVGVAEHCRACNGRVDAEQLTAVKQSVAGHVAIACRHGYAVASECPLRARESGAPHDPS